LLSSAIAGQLIFHGQGDTPAISFRYGLLYLIYSGLPWAIRGEYPFVLAVICQILVAVLIYWLARRWVTVALIVLGCTAAVICLWLLLMAPQLFD
jgi:hypothetical protein